MKDLKTTAAGGVGGLGLFYAAYEAFVRGDKGSAFAFALVGLGTVLQSYFSKDKG